MRLSNKIVPKDSQNLKAAKTRLKQLPSITSDEDSDEVKEDADKVAPSITNVRFRNKVSNMFAWFYKNNKIIESAQTNGLNTGTVQEDNNVSG